MTGGAYRDTGAAIERAEALEREVEELRAELTRLRAQETGRKTKEPPRIAPDVQRMHDELVNLRAENELLRSGLERDSPAPRSVREEPVAENDVAREEIAALRTELGNAHRAIEMREEEIERLRARLDRDATADNRDAVIRRLGEEREELARELKAARDGYEAEPPASRDPKTFEERVLAILSRLVK